MRALQARGTHVVGLSRRPSEADEHEECDVSDRAAVDAVAARVLERHPRIDLLVNNAGVGARGNYLDVDPERIEQVLRVNYLGSVWTTLHLFKEQEVSELLGIPEHMMQVALFPVAYTIGADFKAAARPPVEDITSWDTWGQSTPGGT